MTKAEMAAVVARAMDKIKKRGLPSRPLTDEQRAKIRAARVIAQKVATE